MPRWEPKARERLVTAALELFEARGYDKTSVADIAARAGLTERTFFNCFPDKREVLFYGAESLEVFLAETVRGAPPSASVMITVSEALLVVARTSDKAPEFADFARRRHALLELYPELRERERSKLASLASAIAGSLRARGGSEAEARLAAEVGIAVFKVAFERCMSDPKHRRLELHVRQALDGLAGLQCPLNRRALKRAPAPDLGRR